MQKQTKIKMNDIDSRKLGGAPPQLPSCEGKLPTLPPATASLARAAGGARATEGSWAALGTRDSESVAEGARPLRVSFC